MIRVVLDTNILISGLLCSYGPSAHILLLTFSRSIRLCINSSIYMEYEEVISRPRFQINSEIVNHALQTIRDSGLWFRSTESVRACCDPDDNTFLECAHAAQANYLVTGNIKHFPAMWGKTEIVTPRHFLDHLSRHKRNS